MTYFIKNKNKGACTNLVDRILSHLDPLPLCGPLVFPRGLYNPPRENQTITQYLFITDFKKNYKMYDPIEIVDFYQMICFLLQIPPEDHHGSWERIAPMLEISSAPSVLSFNCITFVLFFIPILLF